ncbi:Inositol hexakisphosphate and diphosphoinositol-pentakisphosphate kinase [Parelaphostrongylus tenuis]|uniref:Inositol hexakisphosphate and diphosphoinositol-pentakisphosphate kinase n=1 Tax=Parelaphostrongylus tenuis TaxID=148309 RepID=A0AAD5RD56_PARTN|nr:Inositol hexakisphosphate and diphosphoinositol-pentakisphosphate kinase [Parelaphostrongylus tenuis]
MVLRSTGSLRARLMKDEINENHLTRSDSVYDQEARNQLVPYKDFYNDMYLGNITIGTPGQEMSVLVDTSSANFWVFDTTCRSFSCLGFPGSGFTRRRFNTRRSSTFMRQRKLVSLPHAAGSCSGPVAKDVVSFAGI